MGPILRRHGRAERRGSQYDLFVTSWIRCGLLHDNGLLISLGDSRLVVVASEQTREPIPVKESPVTFLPELSKVTQNRPRPDDEPVEVPPPGPRLQRGSSRVRVWGPVGTVQRAARKRARTLLTSLVVLLVAACQDAPPTAPEIGADLNRAHTPAGPQSDRPLSLHVVAGGGSSTEEGIPATEAQLSAVEGVDARPNGILVIADTYNNRIVEVDRGGLIRTIAGTGVIGSAGEGGPALEAEFFFPFDVAVSPRGEVFIADTYNHRIRVIDRSGVIRTVAGTGTPGSAGTGGPATEAQLSFPFGVDVSADGRVLISDTFNHRVLTIDRHGNLQPVAGTGVRGFSGDGGPAEDAQLAVPYTARWGQAGEILIADTSNDRIRAIARDGTIRTIAGTGERGFGGDGGPAVEALLAAPHTLAVEATGRIVVGDTNNNRLREIRPDGTLMTLAGDGSSGVAPGGSPARETPLRFRTGLVSPRPGVFVLAEYLNARVVELR